MVRFGMWKEMLAESRERIAEWNEFGRDLYAGFLAQAAGEAVAA